MILDVLLNFHTWSSSRPEYETANAADTLLDQTQRVMATEEEQGMSLFFFRYGCYHPTSSSFCDMRYRFTLPFDRWHIPDPCSAHILIMTFLFLYFFQSKADFDSWSSSSASNLHLQVSLALCSNSSWPVCSERRCQKLVNSLRHKRSLGLSLNDYGLLPSSQFSILAFCNRYVVHYLHETCTYITYI